jgi:hypothetical protein
MSQRSRLANTTTDIIQHRSIADKDKILKNKEFIGALLDFNVLPWQAQPVDHV